MAFLQENAGRIAFVTIDIGANDALSGGGAAAVAQNLPPILTALRAAAGPGVPIIGMNYYDPFVAPVWFQTQSLAALQARVTASVALNDFLEGIYQAFGMRSPTSRAPSRSPMSGLVDGTPVNVLRACAWTWMCSAQDIHANSDGYGLIAEAFLAELED